MRYLKTIGVNSNQPIGRGFNFPYDTALSSDGRIFVLNRTTGPRVHICTFDEEWLGEFGAGPEEGDDRLKVPSAMAFNSEDLLFVTDEALNEIKVFDSSGQFVRKLSNDAGLGAPLCQHGQPAGNRTGQQQTPAERVNVSLGRRSATKSSTTPARRKAIGKWTGIG